MISPYILYTEEEIEILLMTIFSFFAVFGNFWMCLIILGYMTYRKVKIRLQEENDQIDQLNDVCVLFEA